MDLSLSEMLVPVLLVASLRARVLSLRAKHLFVAATVYPGLRSGLAQRGRGCGAPRKSSSLRHRLRRVGIDWVAEEAEATRLI